VWSRTFGGEGIETALHVAVDSAGAVIVSGLFSDSFAFGTTTLLPSSESSAFIAKLSAAGDPLWALGFGATTVTAPHIAVSPADELVISGSFKGELNLGGSVLKAQGETDIYLAKLTSGGMHLWSTKFGDVKTQSGVGVAVDQAGNIQLLGHSNSKVVFDPLAALQTIGMNDLLLVKLDADGGALLQQRFGATDKLLYGRDIALDPDNNVLFVSSGDAAVDFGDGKPVVSAVDGHIVKRSSQLGHAWSLLATGVGDTHASALAVSANRIFVTGLFYEDLVIGNKQEAAKGRLDYLVSLDAAGKPVHLENTSAVTKAVAADAADHVLLGGFFNSTFLLGDIELVAAGGTDAFVGKRTADGQWLWARRFGDGADQTCEAMASDAAGSAVIVGRFNSTISFDDEEHVADGTDWFVARLAP